MALADDMMRIEVRLTEAGSSITKLCKEAGLARSTWDRWRRGETEPNLKSWRAVEAAVQMILSKVEPGEEAA